MGYLGDLKIFADSLGFIFVLISETVSNKAKEETAMSKLYAGLAFIKDGSMDFDEILLYFSDNPYINSVLISETVFKNKMKRGKDMSVIKNESIVDFRNFTPGALGKIEEITNVATVLLPKDMPPEFSEAYANIKKTNVAKEISMSPEQNICIINGEGNITCNDVEKDSFIIGNGILIVRDMPQEMNLSVIVNGILVKTKSAKVNIQNINGRKIEIDDDASIICSEQKIEIDKNFIENINTKTAILAVDRVEIKDDVTADMLKEKAVFFGDINTIIAPKALHGYIQANSVDINRIAEEKKKLFGIFRRR